MDSVLPKQSRIATLSDKHCVFQCGDTLFALPATSVREVTLQPPIVSVPLSHPSLAGIGNLRSEFLPIIDLESLIGNQRPVVKPQGQLIVIDSPYGSWAIAIDRVISIDAIETHIDASQRSETSTRFLLGTASYSGNVLSVLDINSLERIAQETLESGWQGIANHSASHDTAPSSASQWTAV